MLIYDMWGFRTGFTFSVEASGFLFFTIKIMGQPGEILEYIDDGKNNRQGCWRRFVWVYSEEILKLLDKALAPMEATSFFLLL